MIDSHQGCMMRPDDKIHFCAPTRLILSCGSRSQLPALMAHLGYRHGVLVTDRFFTEHTPWVSEYVCAAGALGIMTIVFDGGSPDPTTTLCDEATLELRAAVGGQTFDHVLALGGGSNIDLAKALCVTLPGGRPVREFVGDIGQGRPLPLVALPTTSGTGAGSPSSGPLSATGSDCGLGEVETAPVSSLSVTLTRSGGGSASGGLAVTSTQTSAIWPSAASARPNDSSRVRADVAIFEGYGLGTEPVVTSEIAVNPARLSSPITAITAP